jgi:hypothetical protein
MLNISFITRVYLGDVGSLRGGYFMSGLIEEVGSLEAHALYIVCVWRRLASVIDFKLAERGGKVKRLLLLLRQQRPRELARQHPGLLHGKASGGMSEGLFRVVQSWASAFVDYLSSAQFLRDFIEQVVLFLLDVAAARVPLDWRLVVSRSWYLLFLGIAEQVPAYCAGKLVFYPGNG